MGSKHSLVQPPPGQQFTPNMRAAGATYGYKLNRPDDDRLMIVGGRKYANEQGHNRHSDTAATTAGLFTPYS